MPGQREWLQDLVDDFIDCILDNKTAEPALIRIPATSHPHDKRPHPKNERS